MGSRYNKCTRTLSQNNSERQHMRATLCQYHQKDTVLGLAGNNTVICDFILVMQMQHKYLLHLQGIIVVKLVAVV